MRVPNVFSIPWLSHSKTIFVFSLALLLADLGEARGCSTNTFVIDLFINSVGDDLWKYLYSAATP